MNEDVGFVGAVALTWGGLALVYDLMPALGMIGYACVSGFGSLCFFVLAALLWRRHDRARGPGA